MGLNEQAVLKTVLYADIFDFPLTDEEIWKYLISDTNILRSRVKESIVQLVKSRVLTKEGSYSALDTKKSIIHKRKNNLPFIKEKTELAQKASVVLKTIPSILFIGISGGLAVGNIEEDDDIDLFIVSEGGSMWMTRMLSVLLLSRYGVRRTRGDRHEKNKICLNMFLSSTDLAFPSSRRDIYTAHELAQLTPLFSRGNTYQKLLRHNRWISTFLQNSFEERIVPSNSEKKRITGGVLFSKPMVQFAKLIQQLHMWPYKTTETVSDTLFAFHPRDYKGEVLKAYSDRLQKYGLKIR